MERDRWNIPNKHSAIQGECEALVNQKPCTWCRPLNGKIDAVILGEEFGTCSGRIVKSFGVFPFLQEGRRVCRCKIQMAVADRSCLGKFLEIQ
jgi:hypothetical protein